MNVKCPYCDCCYELDGSLLRDPIGHEKLGYGWWLRCHRCRKKWWLNYQEVAPQAEPPTADRQAQIERLEGLVGIRRPPPKPPRKLWKILLPLIFVGVTFATWLVYSSREAFRGYILKKAENIAKSPAAKVTMTDVKYTVSGGVIDLNGVIRNDDKTVVKVKGVRVSVFDGTALVKTWDSALPQDFVLPEDSMAFTVSGKLDGSEDDLVDMRVEVSVL